MTSEYVRLSPPEKVFGEKHLLGAQLELLTLIQRFHRYRVLRDEELILKVTFKNYVDETLKEIAKLERMLPKAHYKEMAQEKKEGGEGSGPKKLSLEEEIAKVRAKLSKLQADLS